MAQESVLPRVAAQPVTTKRSAFRRHEAILGWLLVTPALVIVLGMVGYPFLEAVRISFTDKMIGMGAGRWVGLSNYEYIIGWPAFGSMVMRTVAFTIAAVFIKTIVGLILATAMNQEIPFRNVLRGLFGQ